jgi:hypothetical protein
MSMSPEFGCLRASVRVILSHAAAFEWTVQGFGMMRTYFGEDKQHRLNVWHSGLSVPNVSIIHDHPWRFQSWVLSGQIMNRRYNLHFMEGNDRIKHKFMIIEPGEQGGPRGEPQDAWLHPRAPEGYYSGGFYSQLAHEVHSSHPLDGTVTINDRRDRGPDIARVFWQHGDWVDAKPRPATQEEVRFYSEYSLSQYGNFNA